MRGRQAANIKVCRQFDLESKLSPALTFVPRYVSCQISCLPGVGIILSLSYLAVTLCLMAGVYKGDDLPQE